MSAPLDDFDPQRVLAELRRWVERITAEPSPRHTQMLDQCARELRSRRTKAARWCAQNGEHLAAVATGGVGAEMWAAMLYALLRRDYGGETLWQNKRPAEAKLRAARTMTARQLMEKFGISKARAYQLLNDPRRKKV